jgi:hypothetical protein
MILGSTNQINYRYINRVRNFNFEHMEKFNPQFLVGYHGEKISLPLDEGFKQAKQDVQWIIRNTIERDVGGDEVRIINMHTQYNDVTFKQVLVPIYNGLYTYKGKQYHFVMNGQTGQFSGGSPTSVAKVVGFIFMILAIVLVVVLFFVKVFA